MYDMIWLINANLLKKKITNAVNYMSEKYLNIPWNHYYYTNKYFIKSIFTI